ncbi:3-oxoacyl-(acyl-carrier-protein) synthase III [Ferrimonas balearica DSM 9799]|uniref:Beta-ketoacyl-[acyl-carrier-protein] synthase III n=1 Tax=Ferrimonas balearica (strain DSM 9799 / CCM 4581 / KCTC 23876 / PAT) TaxID=550540 RepID=E1SMT7_FERBD|nr:ketoacyl-ACP synthase III [Ferrimonas balearica]ADN76606.1 3-oxoacyl-(acyl-carrier-protein) synthase III [Ferrimonas balearica DSM 9799]MBY5982319.1 ketoacyl-ACP synthase III [Ferrimonas balearica]
MRSAEITGWGKCLPPAVLSNDDLATVMDTSDEWIRSRTGIGQRHISHVGTAELASVAAQRALDAAGLDGTDIDMIILATASPDTLVPNIAATVQANIGARCAAFDINAACSGFLYGLGLATAQVRSGQCQRVLVVGAERLTFYLNWTLRDTAVLFGDGAGAVVVEATDEPVGVLSYAMNNDPEGREILKVAGFGSAMDRSDPEAMSFFLQFEGREIFKRAIAGMGRLSQQVLAESGVSPEQVDLVVPHQANVRIIDTLIGKMGLPKEKAFVNIERYGNTSAATVPIALCDALEAGRIQPGDTLLSCAFGAGLTSAAAVIKWGQRTTPLRASTAELPPCDQTGLELIRDAVARDKAKAAQ